MALWTKLSATDQLVPMPSLVTFTPVLPSVTSGIGDFGGAARSESLAARTAPEAAVVLRNWRRLPPHEPSIVLPPEIDRRISPGRHSADVPVRGVSVGSHSDRHGFRWSTTI